MATPKYEQLPADEYVKGDGHAITDAERRLRSARGWIRILVGVAVMSCLTNLLQGLYIVADGRSRLAVSQQPAHDRTLYADLARDVPIARHEGAETLFGHPNRSIADAAWESWEVNPGIVALPRELVEEKALPRAQDWPWDHDKGIYLINGYHNLHCLYMIRKTILAAGDGKLEDLPESMFEHSLHCIESLRQDTLCNADDTPLYTGFNEEHLAGTMQSKMCRSWDKLEAWTRRYTACYRDVGRWVPGFKLIDRFKYCPDGYVFSATGSTIAPWDTGDGQLGGGGGEGSR